MNMLKFCSMVITLFVFVVGANPCAQADDERDKFGTTENKRYSVTVEIGSGPRGVADMIVSVKNKIIKKDFGAKLKVVFVENIQEIFFVGENTFLVEGHFQSAKGLLIGLINEDNTLKLFELRLVRYLLNPDKTGFVYSDWTSQNILYSFNFFDALHADAFYEGKVIFTTGKKDR